MKIENVIRKLSEDQFVVKNLYGDKPFALTESTPKNRINYERNKTITIDFGDNNTRYIDLDILLLVLQEFYGKDFLISSIEQIKNYDEIKDKIIPNL